MSCWGGVGGPMSWGGVYAYPPPYFGDDVGSEES